MTTYTDTSTLNTDPKDPHTSELMTALKLNPLAIAEGATDAVVNQSSWHPYNMVNVGDGNDGLFYDKSVDGSVGSFDTPDFANGYEYAIAFENFSATGDDVPLRVSVLAETSATFITIVACTNNNSTIGGAGEEYNGILRIPYPRLVTNNWGVVWETPFATPANVMADAGAGFTNEPGLSTAQKILRARIDWTGAASIDNGKMYLLRRREFFTG